MRELRDKVVAITGGANGIGAALARAFAERGARIALLDTDAEGLQREADALESHARISTHRVDVRLEEALALAATEISESHGGLDVLVNNAGITGYGPFETLDPADFKRIIDVNMWGVIHGCRAFLPLLRQRTSGHVVNVASEAGLAGMPWQTHYCTTKFAIRGFTAALRAELAADGIGVTCVLPGMTATRILRDIPTTDPVTSGQIGAFLDKRGAPPQRAARTIVRGVRRNRAEVFPGFDSWLMDWGVRFTPWAVRGFMRHAGKLARHREAAP